MGYSNDNGYVATSVAELMALVMENINTEFGTSYTAETFEGTNFYKYFYAAIQEMQRNEVKTSEIFLKMQDYFNETNEKVLRPLVTPPGIIDALLEAGYTASVKPAENADAGKAFICVDVDDAADDYAETKLEICNLIKDYVVAGVVPQGTEEELIVISNGQEFPFRFNLPDRTDIKLRLTLTISRNNKSVIASDDDIKDTLLANIQAKYSLGKDFEPETYFSVLDAPWCSDILLEYSLDGGSVWLDDVYESEYDEIFDFDLTDITLVQS